MLTPLVLHGCCGSTIPTVPLSQAGLEHEILLPLPSITPQVGTSRTDDNLQHLVTGEVG